MNLEKLTLAAFKIAIGLESVHIYFSLFACLYLKHKMHLYSCVWMEEYQLCFNFFQNHLLYEIPTQKTDSNVVGLRKKEKMIYLLCFRYK